MLQRLELRRARIGVDGRLVGGPLPGWLRTWPMRDPSATISSRVCTQLLDVPGVRSALQRPVPVLTRVGLGAARQAPIGLGPGLGPGRQRGLQSPSWLRLSPSSRHHTACWRYYVTPTSTPSLHGAGGARSCAAAAIRKNNTCTTGVEQTAPSAAHKPVLSSVHSVADSCPFLRCPRRCRTSFSSRHAPAMRATGVLPTVSSASGAQVRMTVRRVKSRTLRSRLIDDNTASTRRMSGSYGDPSALRRSAA